MVTFVCCSRQYTVRQPSVQARSAVRRGNRHSTLRFCAWSGAGTSGPDILWTPLQSVRAASLATPGVLGCAVRCLGCGVHSR